MQLRAEATDAFNSARDVNSFPLDDFRPVVKWQVKVDGHMLLDIRIFTRMDRGRWIATRHGLCREPNVWLERVGRNRCVCVRRNDHG